MGTTILLHFYATYHNKRAWNGVLQALYSVPSDHPTLQGGLCSTHHLAAPAAALVIPPASWKAVPAKKPNGGGAIDAMGATLEMIPPALAAAALPCGGARPQISDVFATFETRVPTWSTRSLYNAADCLEWVSAAAAAAAEKTPEIETHCVEVVLLCTGRPSFKDSVVFG